LTFGQINSPQILEHSGVGRPEILKKNNIEVIHELEGVGENLMDHLGPRLVYKIKKPGLSYNEKARGFGLIKQALNYAFNQDGFAVGGGSSLCMIGLKILSRSACTEYPNVQPISVSIKISIAS